MNRALLITYDLKAPSRDYTPLHDAIKRSPKWFRPLESTWLIITAESPQQVWARLAALLAQPDRLLIIEVSGNYFGWLPKESWEWMSQNIPK